MLGIITKVERAAGLTQKLLAFSQSKNPTASLDLGEVVEHTSSYYAIVLTDVFMLPIWLMSPCC